MEEYVGLDVSMKQTCVCVVDSHDRVVAEGVVATCPDALARFVAKRAPGAVRIGLETGSLSGWLWRGLLLHPEGASGEAPSPGGGLVER